MNYSLHRLLQFAVTGVTLLVLMASFYFQYVKHLQPCPLCLMQRFIIILLLIIGLTQCFNSKLALAKKLSWWQILLALAGLYFAGRQIWLQSLPSGSTLSCLPGLDILVRYFSWQDVLHALMFGASDCAEVSWRWLGLTMPAWSALYFIGVVLAEIVNRYLNL